MAKKQARTKYEKKLVTDWDFEAGIKEAVASEQYFDSTFFRGLADRMDAHGVKAIKFLLYTSWGEANFEVESYRMETDQEFAERKKRLQKQVRSDTNRLKTEKQKILERAKELGLKVSEE